MTVVKRAIRDEKGAALVLALVLLVVGGLILTPLLGLMSTGLLAGQVYEERAAALYACDAGIEDAIWHLLYDPDGLSDEPYRLGGPVKEMDVTVEKMGEDPIAGGGILYTVKSTATKTQSTASQDEGPVGEVIAAVKWQPMPLVEGTSPGAWPVKPDCVSVLTTIAPDSIAFGMQLGQGTPSGFLAAGPDKLSGTSDDQEVNFEKNDLLGANLTSYYAWVWFSAGDYGLGTSDQDSIADAHHYVDGDGYECLLMCFESICPVPVGNETVSNGYVVTLHVDPADPFYRQYDLFLGDIGQYFKKQEPDIEALGRLENGDGRLPHETAYLLFSIDGESDLASPFSGTFDKHEVIALDLGDPSDPSYPDPGSFELYLDAWTHILKAAQPGNPSSSDRPAIASLSPLPAWTWGGEQHPDGRLMIAFDRAVVGSDSRTIEEGDIAIWTPDGWDSGEQDGEWRITSYGYPYSPEHPGTINLHIDMHGGGYFEQIFIFLSILSWNVER